MTQTESRNEKNCIIPNSTEIFKTFWTTSQLDLRTLKYFPFSSFLEQEKEILPYSTNIPYSFKIEERNVI
jgi:hypothetical protein